jgi:RNA polymerase sigma factor (TIGR02999 family)
MSTSSRPPAAPVPASDVTGLLHAWGDGDDAAGERLIAAVYGELHERAARAMRREPGDATLQATALVHEAYLRLADQRHVAWRSRGQFFGVAARMMRRILVDHARARHAAKRGGDARASLTLGDADRVAPESTVDALDVLALDDALERLAALDADQARLVELRYFAGLGIDETADALGVSPATVKREWATARAWLRRELAAS